MILFIPDCSPVISGAPRPVACALWRVAVASRIVATTPIGFANTLRHAASNSELFVDVPSHDVGALRQVIGTPRLALGPARHFQIFT